MPALIKKGKTCTIVNWISWGSMRLMMTGLIVISWGKCRHPWKIWVNKCAKLLSSEGWDPLRGQCSLQSSLGPQEVGAASAPWHLSPTLGKEDLKALCFSHAICLWPALTQHRRKTCLQEFNATFVSVKLISILISYILEVKFQESAGTNLIHLQT